jgi:hypothetical protein
VLPRTKIPLIPKRTKVISVLPETGIYGVSVGPPGVIVGAGVSVGPPGVLVAAGGVVGPGVLVASQVTPGVEVSQIGPNSWALTGWVATKAIKRKAANQRSLTDIINLL